MSTDKVTETRRMYTKDGRRISDNMRYSPDTTRAERRAKVEVTMRYKCPKCGTITLVYNAIKILYDSAPENEAKRKEDKNHEPVYCYECGTEIRRIP